MAALVASPWHVYGQPEPTLLGEERWYGMQHGGGTRDD
jgi:hypothetical protein